MVDHKKDSSTSKASSKTSQGKKSNASEKNEKTEYSKTSYRDHVRGVVGIIGGGGFVGRYLVPILAKEGYLVKVGGRNPDHYLHLKTGAVIGQIQLHSVDVRSKTSLVHFIEGCDVIINLVGILFERGKQNFSTIHEEASKNIAAICKEKAVQQLIYVSALGIDPSSRSRYARSKALAEKHTIHHFPEATIVRPSLLYGAEDHFFNRFAKMIRLSPIIPVFKGGKTLFQPLFVRDLAKGIAAILHQEEKGKIFEFGGSETLSFRDLIEKTMDIIAYHRPIVSMPSFVAVLFSLISRILPSPIITRDQLRLLEIDSITSGKYPGFKELNIKTESLDEILEKFLIRFKK